MYCTNIVAFAEVFRNDENPLLSPMAVLADYEAFPPLGALHTHGSDDWFWIDNCSDSENNSVLIVDGLDYQYVDHKPTFAQIAERAGTNHAIPPSALLPRHWDPRPPSSHSRTTKTREERCDEEDDDLFWFNGKEETPIERSRNRALKLGISKRKKTIADISLRQTMRSLAKDQTNCIERYASNKTRYQALEKQFNTLIDLDKYHWGTGYSYQIHREDGPGAIDNIDCMNELYDRITDTHPQAVSYRRCKSKEEAVAKYMDIFIASDNAAVVAMLKKGDSHNWYFQYPVAESDTEEPYYWYFLRLLHRRDISQVKHLLRLLADCMAKIKKDESRLVFERLPRRIFPPGEKTRLRLVHEITNRFNQEILQEYGPIPDLQRLDIFDKC
ncbi:hypothetical protein BX666DRAFT_2123030 [Dichotomocladium elegans]|nr:hypothetical protein BX666DRAFT_2123030 [Dichotomocladium elegans]